MTGVKERSPLRSEEHCESVDRLDMKKQKLAFGCGRKTDGNEQKRGIQIKLDSASVSKTFVRTVLYFFSIFSLLFENSSFLLPFARS